MDDRRNKSSVIIDWRACDALRVVLTVRHDLNAGHSFQANDLWRRLANENIVRWHETKEWHAVWQLLLCEKNTTTKFNTYTTGIVSQLGSGVHDVCSFAFSLTVFVPLLSPSKGLFLCFLPQRVCSFAFSLKVFVPLLSPLQCLFLCFLPQRVCSFAFSLEGFVPLLAHSQCLFLCFLTHSVCSFAFSLTVFVPLLSHSGCLFLCFLHYSVCSFALSLKGFVNLLSHSKGLFLCFLT